MGPDKNRPAYVRIAFAGSSRDIWTALKMTTRLSPYAVFQESLLAPTAIMFSQDVCSCTNEERQRRCVFSEERALACSCVPVFVPSHASQANRKAIVFPFNKADRQFLGSWRLDDQYLA